jgi:hypothetical protein
MPRLLADEASCRGIKPLPPKAQADYFAASLAFHFA